MPDILIGELAESKTNPRKHFDPVKLAELAASAKQHGILEPLLVRVMKGGKHEIVAGARRYRAAKIAELKVLPVRVMELTDEQVLEIQLIENLQREDPHPMEEADGYQRLIAMGHTADELALKVGKDRSYIYKRIQLTELLPGAKDAFLENRINIGHALLLCRLPVAPQTRAFNELFPFEWKGNKRVHNTQGRATMSAKELAQFIREEVLLDLSAAPWKKDDAMLAPKAGPCTTCPKHTGANAALFDDFRKGDHCLDAECYGAKRQALIQLTLRTEPMLPQIAMGYGEQPKGALPRDKYRVLKNDADKCKFAQAALVIGGDHQVGHKILICCASDCKKHSQRSAYSSGSSRPTQSFADLWAERKKKLPQKIEWTARLRVLEAILAEELEWTIPHEQLQTIALALLPQSICSEIIAALRLPWAHEYKGLKGFKLSEGIEKIIRSPQGSPAGDHLDRIVLALSLEESAKEYCYKDGPHFKRLKDTAAHFGVDWAAVQRATSAELTQDFEKRRAKAEVGRDKNVKKAKAAAK